MLEEMKRADTEKDDFANRGEQKIELFGVFEILGFRYTEKIDRFRKVEFTNKRWFSLETLIEKIKPVVTAKEELE